MTIMSSSSNAKAQGKNPAIFVSTSDECLLGIAPNDSAVLVAAASTDVNRIISPLERVEQEDSHHQIAVPRSVRFTGADLSFLSEDEDISTNRVIENLRTRLHQAEIDLTAERAIRKRKDKNIVKLAKQLKAKAADSDRKERKLVQMAQCIKSLDTKLQNQYQQQYENRDSSSSSSSGSSASVEDQLAKLRLELDASKMQVETLQTQLADRHNYAFLAVFVTILVLGVFQVHILGTCS